MAKYGKDAFVIEALVRDAEVHRDVYVDGEIFELELEHLFPNSWIYVGHASELRSPGDFRTRWAAGRPLILVRDRAGAVHCLINTCRHRGA